MLDPQELRRRITEALPGSEVDVKDTTGTGDHFEARVIAESFTGKTKIEQHQMVYAPLKDLLATGELHALALNTFSPEQWKKSASAQTRK